jgi:2-dehydro-3-deoxy-D-gluconate 5-dehydrogenase
LRPCSSIAELRLTRSNMSDSTAAGPFPGSASLFDLTGRSVLVTGAGRGLGRGMALAVAAAGARVAAVSRTAEQLQETAALDPGGRILPLAWDIAQLGLADSLIHVATELAGPIYGVVHAAGVQHRAHAIDFSVDAWRQVTSVDLEAPFFLSTALHRAQVTHGQGGAHVFVGSLASSIGLSRTSAYSASKSGIVGIVRTLALEWAGAGARVNCVAPGYFKTALTADLFADPERAAWVLSRIPMKRLGLASDLAGAVIFLLSDASAYITGQVLNVDGGWLAA